MEKQTCPKCKSPDAYKANTKYGVKLRCSSCDSWFPWVTQPQTVTSSPDNITFPPQPVKNDRDASITAIAFIKSILENERAAELFFEISVKAKEDVREEIWSLFIWFRERCRKYE